MSNPTSLSIVVSFRDRDSIRVKRFLDSLADQTYTDFEVHFVDYGSSPGVKNEISKLCDKYAFCHYLYSHSEGHYWNRSHALNIGIRRCRGTYILTTDIDIVFTRSALQQTMEFASEKSVYNLKARLTTRDFSSWTSIDQDLPEFDLSGPKTLGLFQLAHRDVHFAINGFDEFFKIWGREDNDWQYRALKTGAEQKWLPEDRIYIYHQWHPVVSVRNNSYPAWWWDEMSLHGELNKVNYKQIEWGRPVEEEERFMSTFQAPPRIMDQQIRWYEKTVLLEELFTKYINDGVCQFSFRCHPSKPIPRLKYITRSVRMALMGPSSQQSRATTSSEPVDFLHYVLISLLDKSDVLQDYSVVPNEDQSVTFNVILKQ